MARSPQIPQPLRFELGLTQTGNVVNLKQAKFLPEDLGGVYILPSTGIGITTDGGLGGIQATPNMQGMIIDAPYDSKAYARLDGRWIETTRPDPATIPIAGYTAPEVGAVWITPGRALRVEPTGELDVLPASPTQLGVILDPPFDSGNPDVTYARKWGAWVVSSPAFDYGIGLATSAGAPGDPQIVNLTPAGDSVTTLGGIYVTDRIRTNTSGLELDIDGQLRAPLATEIYAGTILEPLPDDKKYVRTRSAAGISSWVEAVTSGIIVADAAPVSAPLNSLWWDSDSGTLAINYQDVDTTQWVQIAGPLQSTTSSATIGDVKSGFQIIDHDGWIKLDGRATSTLTATQQANAIALGFATNIPNADGALPMQSSAFGPLQQGDLAGSMDRIIGITQANLPDIDLTTAIDGNHQHSVSVRDDGITNSPGEKNIYSLVVSGGDARWSSRLLCSTEGAISYTDYGNFMNAGGEHDHIVSLGGSGAPIQIDVTPKAFAVNYFCYLGA